MKKHLFVIFFVLPTLLYAQKVKLDDKTGIVAIDAVESFKIDRSGCGFGMVDCHYDVFDLAGTKLIRVNYKEYKSLLERKPSNPEGIVRYLEFVFLDAKAKAEVAFPGIKEEKVAKLIAKSGLFTEGKLNAKAVDEFVLVHGTSFSAQAGK